MKTNEENPFCRCLLFSANALSRVITKIADEEFSLLGISYSHAFILMSVNKDPGIQPGVLSAVMMLSPSTITRLLEKMEEKGLIERSVEGKYCYLYPTKKGTSMDKKVREAWKRIFERYDSVLGKEISQSLTHGIFNAAVKLS